MSLFPKLKLSPKLIRFAYHFVDLEASGEKDCLTTRVIEYSFAIQKLGSAQGKKLLDIGCTSRWNLLPATLVGLGWEVYGIDIREFKFRHPNFHFVCEDVRNTSFPDNFFDCVCAISTIEHIGLSGRFGVAKEDPKGDVKAIKEVERIIRPGGTFLVTVPYGKRVIIRPLHKVYDKAWLRELFLDWRIKDEIYYVRNENGYWEAVPEKVAALVNNKTSEDAIALLELLPLK
jgi:SAM-dependent methyltransferase